LRGLRSRRFRTVAVLATFAMIATACSDSGTTDPEGEETAGEDTETETDDEGGEGGEGSEESFVYNTGIFEDTTTDNFWAYMDPDSSVWNAYVLSKTKSALYAIEYPDLTLVPDLATEDFPEPVEDGDGWSVEVQIKEDANWSDGEPITADDFVFTYETVRDLSLSGNWLANLPTATEDNTGITGVEAVDEKTVKYTFNNRPGLGVWPHSVGVAPVMPKHFWEDVVEEAKNSDEPATALYEASGADEPSGGPFVFAEREAGAFARITANESYHDIGREVTFESGEGGSYTTGPYASEEILSLYAGQDAAVLALQEGEVDYLYNPLGMQRGLRERVTGDENLTAVSNATNGMRYLAFNFRKAPMDDPAFRKAIATMIDREFMATNVLQGVAFPLYTATPQGNTAWYNEEVAEELKEGFVGYENTADRAQAAIDILTEAGYTWDTDPAPDAELNSVTPGEGLRMPNGELVPTIELLAPGPGYDPLRSTYSVWIQQWGEQLGMPIEANPTNFNVIVEKVFPSSGEPQFDMFILGWSLGNPAFPTFYESFWHTNGGSNPLGYSNPDYDDAADRYLASTSEEEAYEILWNEIEPILAEDLPYVMLFDTPILEFYRTASIQFPTTQTLGGIQFNNGLSGVVRAAS
jgi:peptide/nickel transport system substrate-binding protein